MKFAFTTRYSAPHVSNLCFDSIYSRTHAPSNQPNKRRHDRYLDMKATSYALFLEQQRILEIADPNIDTDHYFNDEDDLEGEDGEEATDTSPDSLSV